MGGQQTAPAHQAPTRRLAAWQPTTLVDWPGRVATTLFLSGCSFSCPFCYNGALREATDAPIDWLDVVGHMECRRDLIDGVVITGGEPTDDPDLPSLLAALKETGIAVKLDTNGSNPRVLSLLLAEGLVDAVALDVKTVPARYQDVAGPGDAAARVGECVAMLIDSGIEHEFRTTAYPGIVSLEELPRIARNLRGGRLYVVQQFRPAATLHPDASTVVPFDEDALKSAAATCARYLPTVVRGIARGGDS